MCNHLPSFDISKFNPQSNIFIDASAGTGKTYTIQQIVAKLIDSGASLDKMLIVTYTEKAAGELRDRIRQKIQESIKQLHNANFEEALKKVDTASIHTIHSFCQKTLEEFAFNAGRPFNMALIDEGEIVSFIDKWIRDELGKDLSWPALYTTFAEAKVFGKEIKDQLIDGIKKYYLKNNWREDKAVVSFDDWFQAAGKQGAKCVDCESYLNVSDEDYNANKEEYNFFDGVFGGRFRAGNYSKTFLGNRRQFYKEQFLKKYIPVLYQAWQKEKAKRKCQTYNDMIRSVREAVCESNSQLLQQLQNKYTYSIIDEFQDTNQLQWDIFSKVFLDLDDHYIYVVGDPKQSIYSFQGADVNVYSKAIGEIQAKGQGYVLDTNYRSTKSMVEACNNLFSKNCFFLGNKTAGLLTFNGSKSCGKIKDATFDNKHVEPFWIAYKSETGKEVESIKSEEFAAIIAEQIVNCCSSDILGKTRLQIFDRDKDLSRNVTFKDFAILARTTNEMTGFESALTKAGIPWMHYKDKSLFNGSECAQWITLLKAIDAQDFTGKNRQILSKALYSCFFNIELNEINNSKYDDPSEPNRNLLAHWHGLAQKRKWSRLVENIFSETEIENRLATLDHLQELMKFRQIGTYLVNYLQGKNCELSDAIKNLTLLSKQMDEDEGNILAIGTDFDCVQIMTIHASKGLEFPVVVMAGGSSAAANWDKTHLYHDSSSHEAKLNMGAYGRGKRDIEQYQEMERLFYVGLTRARSILMMAYYDPKKMPSYSCSLRTFIDENESDYLHLPNPMQYDLKSKVASILNNNKIPQDNSSLPDVGLVSGKAWSRRLRKHSYSSLSHGKAEEDPMLSSGDSDNRTDKEQTIGEISPLSAFDKSSIYYQYDDVSVSKTDIAVKYPKGTELGSALHEVFELADYASAGDNVSGNDDLMALVIRCLRKNGFKIDESDSKKWVAQSIDFIWNTLNAKLPQIKGGCINGVKTFIIKEGAVNRLAEVEFNMDVDDEFKNYCTGSIDLLFNHDGVYSIIDWKSDSLVPEIYGNADEIKKIVDARYSIQRVLYAYSLIKWLKQFNPDKSEAEIFNQQFGGVYYVFLRATQADTFSGTYAHTWNSWTDLEKAYNNIKDTKIVKSQKEDNTNE